MTDNEGIRTSLVVLMGLPGSGKSHLAQNIEKKINSNDLNQSFAVIVRYDDFISFEIQSQFPALSNCSLAKSCRNNFVDSVKFIVAQCTDKNFRNATFSDEIVDELLPFSSAEKELVPKSVFVCKVKDILNLILLKCRSEVVTKLVLVIDDNNYYSSMREDFYQIAKVRRTGFCVIYCKTSILTCRKRNSTRSKTIAVPDKVIIEMSLKLEAPNPMKYACDVFSIEIPEGGSENELESHNSCGNISLVVQVIESSLENPINWVPPPSSEETEKERKICSEDDVHQADLILRKWINKEMGLMSLTMNSQNSGVSKASLSKLLRKRKELVLERLRQGELRLKSTPSQDVEFQQEVIEIVKSLKSVDLDQV